MTQTDAETPSQPHDETVVADSDKSHAARSSSSGSSHAALPKALLIVGLLALGVSLSCAVLSINNIKSFSHPGGVSVAKGTNYYLLANKDALNVTQCSLLGGDNQPANDKLEHIEPLIDESLEIKDISLPLTEGKGVYAKVTFTDDIDGLHFACDKGHTYISTFSGTALNVLRWLTLLPLLLGLACLVAWVVTRSRGGVEKKHTEAQDTPEATEHRG